VTLVLDTCALLCWTHDPARLSGPAQRALAGLREGGRGLLSAASFWEIALMRQAGRLDLGMTPAEYLARVQRLPLEIVPENAALWLASVALEWDHRDPVDRLVVALAQREGADLLTSDRAIRAYYPRAQW
jgi:PIN domain nuclease of toxin-antitoxin system